MIVLIREKELRKIVNEPISFFTNVNSELLLEDLQYWRT